MAKLRKIVRKARDLLKAHGVPGGPSSLRNSSRTSKTTKAASQARGWTGSRVAASARAKFQGKAAKKAEAKSVRSFVGNPARVRAKAVAKANSATAPVASATVATRQRGAAKAQTRANFPVWSRANKGSESRKAVANEIRRSRMSNPKLKGLASGANVGVAKFGQKRSGRIVALPAKLGASHLKKHGAVLGKASLQGGKLTTRLTGRIGVPGLAKTAKGLRLALR